MMKSIAGLGNMTLSTVCLMGAAAMPACMQEDDSPDISETDSEVSGGVFEVGVIPDVSVGCPGGSDEIVIRMDDEDSGNASRRSGYVGKTNLQETSSATRFYFCKVDGTVFRPFTTFDQGSDQRDDYAVLKLGTTCPNGSQEFSRFFDNEDSNNGNFSSGDITPNISNTNTRLFFCLFRVAAPGALTMGSFPDLGAGFSYGVFGPTDFNRGALAFGTIRTDDEDSGNANSYSAPSDALLAAKRIIQPDTSTSSGATLLHVVRAR
jgi:hypothetical protein